MCFLGSILLRCTGRRVRVSLELGIALYGRSRQRPMQERQLQSTFVNGRASYDPYCLFWRVTVGRRLASRRQREISTVDGSAWREALAQRIEVHMDVEECLQ